MPKEQTPGKPQRRRYSDEEKAAAVRMVRTLRTELETEHGTVGRVATQLGYGVESVRQWRQVTWLHATLRTTRRWPHFGPSERPTFRASPTRSIESARWPC